MSESGRPVYEFGGFQLNEVERLLLRSGLPIALPPKAFDILLALVKDGEYLITKDQLMRAVGPDTFVEEVNLCIHLRP